MLPRRLIKVWVSVGVRASYRSGVSATSFKQVNIMYKRTQLSAKAEF